MVAVMIGRIRATNAVYIVVWNTSLLVYCVIVSCARITRMICYCVPLAKECFVVYALISTLMMGVEVKWKHLNSR